MDDPLSTPAVGLKMFKLCFLPDRNAWSSFSGIQSICANLTVTFYSVLNCFAEAAGVLVPTCHSCYCWLDLEICAHLEAEHAMSWLVVPPPIPTHSELLLAWILNQNLLPNQDGKKYFDSSPKIQYFKKKTYAGVAQCECLLWSNIFIFRLDRPFFNIYSAVFIYEYLFVRSKVHNRAVWKTIQKYREGLPSLNRWCLWCNEC